MGTAIQTNTCQCSCINGKCATVYLNSYSTIGHNDIPRYIPMNTEWDTMEMFLAKYHLWVSRLQTPSSKIVSGNGNVGSSLDFTAYATFLTNKSILKQHNTWCITLPIRRLRYSTWFYKHKLCIFDECQAITWQSHCGKLVVGTDISVWIWVSSNWRKFACGLKRYPNFVTLNLNLLIIHIKDTPGRYLLWNCLELG